MSICCISTNEKLTEKMCVGDVCDWGDVCLSRGLVAQVQAVQQSEVELQLLYKLLQDLQTSMTKAHRQQEEVSADSPMPPRGPHASQGTPCLCDLKASPLDFSVRWSCVPFMQLVDSTGCDFDLSLYTTCLPNCLQATCNTELVWAALYVFARSVTNKTFTSRVCVCVCVRVHRFSSWRLSTSGVWRRWRPWAWRRRSWRGRKPWNRTRSRSSTSAGRRRRRWRTTTFATSWGEDCCAE